MEAEQDLARKKRGRLAAAEAHLARMRDLDQLARARYQAGIAASSEAGTRNTTGWKPNKRSPVYEGADRPPGVGNRVRGLASPRAARLAPPGTGTAAG